MATTTLNPAAARSRSALYEWLTTTDHKKIGIMYVINSFIFFFIGGLLALGVRSELAQPGLQFLTDTQYNEFFTMHATFMIFLFVIPMLAGFGNYIVPLQIGAPDMAFPRINALSFWMLPLGGLLLLMGFVTGRDRGRRLDELRAAVGGPPAGGYRLRPGPVDRRAGPDRDQLDPGRDQLPGHDVQDAGARDDPVPDADHGLDRAGHVGPRADGDAGHHQRADHAVHRPQLRRLVLRPVARRRRDPLPEHLLVLLAPGGLRDDPARDGHGQRDPARLLAQAAVRLQGVHLRDRGDRRPRLLGLGPPHVHDGRGLPAVLQHHDVPDRGPDRGQDVQLGVHVMARAADAQDAAAVRARLPDDVPDRRHQRRVQRLGAGRLRAPRHVLGGGPPPLRAVRRVRLRDHGRVLLLVPQDDRQDDERDASARPSSWSCSSAST